MTPNNKIETTERFSLVFDELEEAKKEQDKEFVVCMDFSSQTQETVSLFKEYQESLIQSSYTTFNKA